MTPPGTPEGGLHFPDGPPPLALYIHIPWCVRKCPYCDFNSHPLRGALPETAYVHALLLDLEREVADLATPRPITSIFIGGGTPSLLSGEAVKRLLEGIQARVDLLPEAEISIEANPGTADARSFAAYREAGVNRLSLGVQSLSDRHLKRLGRIHGAGDVGAAVAQARAAGFANLNLDLMYALPDQSLAQAGWDLEQAIALDPEHLSYYQLTLEPNTAFHATPPPIPEHDLAVDMHLMGIETLARAGFWQYEVSAYARGPATHCQHNLNYWQFGDYLGVGASAHGKLTRPSVRRIERRWKLPHPKAYLDAASRGQSLEAGRHDLCATDLVLEFAMNALRLTDGFRWCLFPRRTGLALRHIQPSIESAIADGLLQQSDETIRPTDRGRMFLDDLIQHFAQDFADGARSCG